MTALSCPNQFDPAPALSQNSWDHQVARILIQQSIPPNITDGVIFCQAFILSQITCFSLICS